MIEELALGHALHPQVIHDPVVQPQHRQVQLGYEQVNVVAWVTDQRDSLGVPREVGRFAGVVSPEQQLGRIVTLVLVPAGRSFERSIRASRGREAVIAAYLGYRRLCHRAESMHRPSQLGLVIHPRRGIDEALEKVREWASTHGVAVGQVPIPGQSRRVAESVDVSSCDMLLALGGDGTTLAALHAAAPVARPVLGVACGSIGVLTSVAADRLPWALEQVTAGNWTARALPGLDVAPKAGQARVAINDFVAIRDGTGQVITAITVDGELYARTAGDGVVVATALGSSAYTMAAGGPILGPGTDGIVIMALAHHGGVVPPLVVRPDSRVRLTVEPGYGGGRFEIDGQVLEATATEVTLSQRREYATMIMLADQEPLLTSLRRRGLIVDSPRILARDRRDGT